MFRVASDELNSRVPDGPLQQKWDKHRFNMKLVNPANKRKYSVIVVGTGLAGQPVRRRKDIQVATAAQRTGEGFLVRHRV